VILQRGPRAPWDDKREDRGGGWSPMRNCSAIKANGERCGGIAATGSDYCPAHDPARADARIKAASKAAKSRSVTESDITIIKDALKDLYDGVLEGSVDRSDAAVCSQIANARLRAVELERRIREQNDLEARLNDLEGLLEEAEERKNGLKCVGPGAQRAPHFCYSPYLLCKVSLEGG
jgi:hypothetical protein